MLSTNAKGNICIIGLGGGIIPTFLSKYCINMNINIIEINELIVKLAEQYFGCKYKTTCLLEPITAKTSGFADDNIGAPCELHIADAYHFLPTITDGIYDCIILDVYTNGIFPSSLLNITFFQHLKRILSSNGSLCINAGIGTDRNTVESLCKQVFGTYLILEDRTRSSDSYENCIICCGCIVDINIKISNWYNLIHDIENNTNIDPLPFILSSVSTSENVTLIGWNGVEFKDGKKLKNGILQIPNVPPKMTDAKDPAWNLFD
jgi:hypothetical protein